MNRPTLHIAYGKGGVPLQLEPSLAEWQVFSPKNEKPLPDPQEFFACVCERPTGSPRLRDIVSPTDRVCIVTADGTRPVPNHLLIPWLLEELPVPAAQVTILVGTGTHRANTPDELGAMFGPDVAQRVRIVNHDAYDAARNEYVGKTRDGAAVLFSREYVHADKRIAVGFIEPHFFAGFSGGPKAIAPGVAALDTIFHLHRYDIIAHPQSVWGVLDGNPLHETIRDMVALCPPDFLLNVTLNNEKQITAFFCGDYLKAHRAGCEYVRERAMAPVPHEFPVVVTSNSGYPLDQNLYQTVKGLSAAARIVQPGGSIFVASECSDGVPEHGNFGSMLREAASIEALDERLRTLASPILDQWQAQILAQVCKRASVFLYSSLDETVVRACKLSPIADLQEALERHVASLGRGIPVAVLPEGPLTVPYVAQP